MAAGTSSSRRKSSSSHKKKPSKIPSEVRKKRKSRTSKRDNSKKVRRRDASVSSSDDDSRTEDSLSISSSDSEDGYRHRRAKSRSRGEGKSSKKRVRRSSPSRDDSKDSPHPRKKKGVKRDDGSEARKKTHKRKRGSGRSRRGRSVDSVGSDSLSCSTCRSGSSSEIARGRSKIREKDKTSLRETSNGKSRYRYNSRSCSSCSERSNHGYDERSTRDNHTRRLGSVLTVVNEKREEAERRAQSRDVNKDEIVQSYEDIPLSRSDDSYDGRGTKQSSDRIHAVYEKKGLVDDGRIQETSTRRRSDDAHDEGRMKRSSYQEDDSYEKKRWLDDGVSQEAFTQSSKMNTSPIFVHSDPTKDVTGTPKIEIKSEIGNIVSSTPGHDLESILRQKALENLKKFRGELQTNKKAFGDQKGERDNDVKQPSPVKAEAIQNQIDKKVDNGFTEAKRFNTNAKDNKGSRDGDVKLPSLVKAEVNRNQSHNEVGVRGSGTKGFHTNVKDYKGSRDGTVNLPSLVKAEVNRNQSHNEVGVGGSGTKGLHTNTKALDDQKGARNCLVKHQSTIKAEAIQNQSHKEVVTGVTGAKRAVPVALDMENIPLTTSDRTSANYMKSPDKDSKRLDSMVKLPVSQTVHGDGKSSSERMVGDQDTYKTNTSSVTNKFSEATSTFRQESSHSSSIIKQVPTPCGSPNGGLNKTEISLNKDVTENSKDASGSIKTHDVDKASGSATPKDSSAVTSATSEQGSSYPGAATKGGSEFEQKTMSVMRGGEMVQVSYKVYIPKKTPALARRQLKR